MPFVLVSKVLKKPAKKKKKNENLGFINYLYAF